LVVADEGSNDVTLLLGQGQGASWTLLPGPRLNAQGIGPVATVVRYRPNPKGGPAVADIIVANSQSNDLTLIPGVGGGFFDDRLQSVQKFATGNNPQQVLVGHFRRPDQLDLVALNSGSNAVTFFPNFSPQGQTVATGGVRPVAAVTTELTGLTDLV